MSQSLGKRIFGTALAIGAAAIAPAAAADRPDIEGRWKTDIRDLTLDIGPCGDGYCGQIVLVSGCGETVLRLNRPTPGDRSWQLEGTLKLPSEKETFTASGMLALASPEEGGTQLMLDGYVTPPSYEHREIPFDAVFFRIGPLSCRPGPSS